MEVSSVTKNREYHNILCSILEEEKIDFPLAPDLEDIILHDAEKGHYQLLRIGWMDKKRVFQIRLHLELRDTKIWIQENNTSLALEDLLMQKGISAQQIVLGMNYPEYRQFSDFAEV
ncbi:MAG: element excision factor XisI family protein [Bacteroidota bacterium]